MKVEIRYQLGDAKPVSMIIGNVDKIDIDWLGGIVHLDGRDLTSNFLDHRVYAAYTNKTSSQVAQDFASQYGMQADVDPTTTPISRFYEGEHDHIERGEFTRSLSQWDLLTFLAQHEGYDLWVSGTTLHFKQAVDLASATPWVIRAKGVDWSSNVAKLYSGNFTHLKLLRSLTLAKDVVVVVRSWNSNTKHGFNVSSPKGIATTSPTSKSPAQRYVFVRPNLTKDRAQQLADSLRADITKHERIVEWTDAAGYPGALNLTPRDIVQVEGTGSSWDQRYWVDSIDRQLSVGSGFAMSVKCKNHTQANEQQGAGSQAVTP
jgi:phage protein D